MSDHWRSDRNQTPELPPFPNGWYAVALSSELADSAVLTRRIAGIEIVVFRTASNRVAVLDAHCPHLGAHLGLGGEVIDETIRCPFHGFCFDADGACVATGYGTPVPKGLAARTWPVSEDDGVAYVWFHAHGIEPTWQIPLRESAGWGRLVSRSFSLADHPQETTENSVDVGHFAVVHGYESVTVTEPVATNGTQLTIGYSAVRPMFGRWRSRFEYRIDIHGLGYSHVDVRIPDEGLSARLLVLATPTDIGRVELRMAVRIRSFDAERPRRRGLRMLPAVVGERLVAQAVAVGFMNDARRDFPIWENKAYVHPPRLAEGDGPIGVYRKWASQFYED